MSRNQRVGYVQISMDAGDPGVQREALARAGCTVIYEDALTKGRKSEWPEWERCRKTLRAGDTLVVWRLDRLGRGLSELIRVVTELVRDGIAFESVSDEIATTGSDGMATYRVFAALARSEHHLVRERTHAGLSAARARGRAGGRKPKLDEQDVLEIRALWRDASLSVADIARRYGVSRTTLYKHLESSG